MRIFCYFGSCARACIGENTSLFEMMKGGASTILQVEVHVSRSVEGVGNEHGVPCQASLSNLWNLNTGKGQSPARAFQV